MKLSYQPYKVLLKQTPYVAVALFLVQTISEIREENEVQVVENLDFNVYVSDVAMSSSSSPSWIGVILDSIPLSISCKRLVTVECIVQDIGAFAKDLYQQSIV